MITFQKIVRAASLEEAYELNQGKKNKIIGGMLWLREGIQSFNTVIDISGLGLDKIEESDAEFRIGAMVTLRQLEKHASLNEYTNSAVRDAVSDIVGTQFRNMATIGGSIWGRFGFSDVLTVFLSMDSYVELYKGGIIPLSDFVKLRYDRDIIVSIIVKKHVSQFAYSAMRIQRTDFPVITCAVSKANNEYRVAVGARPAKAVLLTIDAALANDTSAFADYVAKNIPTRSNNRGSAKYRTQLIRVLTSRNLAKIGEQS